MELSESEAQGVREAATAVSSFGHGLLESRPILGLWLPESLFVIASGSNRK
jgi:hypothetical protein